jgi:hypothetical protein
VRADKVQWYALGASDIHKFLTEVPNQGEAVVVPALGHILYLVRSHLVQGGKAESGDDLEIIERAVEPLRVLLNESLKLTEKELDLVEP